MPPVRIKYRKLYRALNAEHPPQGERQAVSAIVGVERGRRACTPEPSPAWGQLPALPFLRSVTWATYSSSLCLCFSSDKGIVTVHHRVSVGLTGAMCVST